jgi:hypothetical protein
MPSPGAGRWLSHPPTQRARQGSNPTAALCQADSMHLGK